VVELMESDIPVVTIDHTFHGCISVLSNNEAGMRELMEYVISMGHKRIAYIFGDASSVTQQRLESFQKTMQAHDLDIPKEYLISSAYRNLEKAAKYTKQLLELPEPPTCILYSDDYSAVGGIGQLRAMGLQIPEDISVAGYDDIFIAGQLRPRLTTVAQDTEKIGKKAAEKLIALIEKKNISLKSFVVNSELRRGESVRRLEKQEQ
jgi:LacI family transcriptional regulator/LacI family purine nucleotide synthesis repressor